MHQRSRAVLAAILAASAAVPCFSADSQPHLRGLIPTGFLGRARLADPSDGPVAASSVRVIDAEEIRLSGARTAGELLAREAGLDVFDQVGNALQPTVDMRGFNAAPSPATAVFVDGVRVNEADFGQVNWQLIPLEDLARVEIHPGPGGAAFGRGALGGVILLATKRAGRGEGAGVEAGASYGSFHRQKSWAAVQGGAASLDWRVFASRDLDGGWRDHSHSNADTLKLKAGWRPDDETDASVSYQHTDDHMRQGGSVTGAELVRDRRGNVSRVETRSSLSMAVLQMRRTLALGASLTGNAYLRARRESTPENAGRTSTSRSLSDMTQRGGVLQLTLPISLGGRAASLSGGIEGGRSEADASSSGDFSGFPFRNGTLHKDDAFAAFAQVSGELVPERLVLSAALRRDESRQHYEDKLTPANGGRAQFGRSSPKVSLSWTPSEEAALHASYAEAFRAPTALELTAIGPFGAAPLNPVKERSWEAGARVVGESGLELKAAAYRTDVSDEIYFDPTQGAFGLNINVPRTRREGVEWQAARSFGRFDLKAGHAWTRATFQSAFSLSKAPFVTQAVRPGDALPMVPEHKGTLELAFRPAAGWRASADAVCVGSQRLVGDEGNDEPVLPAYCTANLGLSWERAGGWRLAVRGTNLTDSRHQVRGILSGLGGRAERFYVPAPGAGVQAELSWRWGSSRPEAAKREIAIMASPLSGS